MRLRGKGAGEGGGVGSKHPASGAEARRGQGVPAWRRVAGVGTVAQWQTEIATLGRYASRGWEGRECAARGGRAVRAKPTSSKGGRRRRAAARDAAEYRDIWLSWVNTSAIIPNHSANSLESPPGIAARGHGGRAWGRGCRGGSVLAPERRKMNNTRVYI